MYQYSISIQKWSTLAILHEKAWKNNKRIEQNKRTQITDHPYTILANALVNLICHQAGSK